jgi:Do/DeqQ family serine protease
MIVRKILLSVVLVVAGFAAGLVLTGRLRTATDSVAEGLAPESAAQAPAGHPAPAVPVAGGAPGPDFTRIAAQTVKAVANISSLQVVRRQNSPFANDPFFSYFFGDQDVFGSRDRRSLSLGSGVVVSQDGYVVTNSHVVGNDRRTIREVTVALADKREIHGVIVGADPATDIALLKIDVKGLPVIPWGDSSRLQVGEWVLAIGSPFELSQTVTAGIVSAIGRANVGFTDYEDFIQTDAAINPGNSGGALINTRGELVGINTGILSQSGGYQGIGFAVPSLLAQRIVKDLMQHGEVRRGTISGLSIEPLTPDIAGQLGATSVKGALVIRAYRDTDAYEAGLRRGDIIVGFNKRPVDDPSQLFRMVADAPIGSSAVLRVVRVGRELEVKVPIVSSARSNR